MAICIKSTDSTGECIIKTQDIFAKTQELTQLLSNGSYLLVQEGISEKDQVILSGLLFQRLGEELYKANIGSCMIGLKPYEGTLYTMVIGSIEEEDKELAESRIITQSIAEAINNELKDILPEYMIPYDYAILESLPLTATGKLDFKKLPKLSIVEEEYIAPSTDMEKQLCKIWEEVLGIDKVGITDDFFRIGGDSIIAIKLISKLNAADILCQITDIFAYNKITLLGKNIEKYKGINLIKTLKGSVDYPKIFYIHPGNGGCEVYQDIANSLADNYLSIGIDNYNLFFSKKITSLEKLSLYYITLLEKNNYLDKNKEIILFGWSLGGKIALEIAYLLEKLGYKNLKIILVDTIFMDEKLEDLSMFVEDINILKLKIKDMILSKKGIDDDNYINTILDAIPVENEIHKNKLSGSLKFTKIVLFKAMEANKIFSKKLNDYCISTYDNNIQQYVEYPIKIINLDKHHYNILDSITDEMIIENIKRKD